MFTIIGAMAELESSLISERVTAGMQAAKARGKQLGRPATSAYLRSQIEEKAKTTDLSVRKIHEQFKDKISESIKMWGAISFFRDGNNFQIPGFIDQWCQHLKPVFKNTPRNFMLSHEPR